MTAIAQESAAQEPAAQETVAQEKSVRYILTLTDPQIESLKAIGMLPAMIPEKFLGRVASIEIKHTDTRQTQRFERDDVLTMKAPVAEVALDDNLIAAIKQRPLRFTIDESSNLGRILLIYHPEPMPIPNQAGPEGSTESNIKHFVRLPDNHVMVGTLSGTEAIQLTTSIGDVKIAIEQIAGIRFGIDADNRAVVVMKNGDSLTGTPDLKTVTIETDWGQQKLNRGSSRN